jgi:hypothetical protein
MQGPPTDTPVLDAATTFLVVAIVAVLLVLLAVETVDRLRARVRALETKTQCEPRRGISDAEVDEGRER